MIALVIGIVFIVVGCLGLLQWGAEFKMVIQGSVPIMLVFGGLLALIAGWTSIKDTMEAKKLEEESKKEGEQK